MKEVTVKDGEGKVLTTFNMHPAEFELAKKLGVPRDVYVKEKVKQVLANKMTEMK